MTNNHQSGGLGAAPPVSGPGSATLAGSRSETLNRRVLALDIGEARIGVAVTDPLGLFAQGIAVWRADEWREKLEECMKRYDPELILLGMPRRTDGSYGPEAENIGRLVRELSASYPDRRFETWDERYTTVIAQRALLEADMSRKKRKERVDKIAAALILQSWMDFRRNALE